MSSALSKSSQSLDSSSCQGSSGPPPSLISSHSLPPPSATHKPRKTVRRVKPNESAGSSDSHSSSRSKNSVSPLTAGELLLVFGLGLGSPWCVTNTSIDPLPTLNALLGLHAGTLPGGDDDAPWVDKHKPMAAVSLLAM